MVKGTAAILGLIPKHNVLFPEPFMLPSLQLGARVPSQMFCPPTLSDRDDLNTTETFEKGKITEFRDHNGNEWQEQMITELHKF